MHVIAGRDQVSGRTLVDDLRLVAASEKVSPLPVPTIETLRVGSQHPAHSGHEVRLRRLQHQMKMVAHETIGVHLPPGLRASLAEGSEERLPVTILNVDSFPAVAPVHDVIPRARILDAQRPGHAAALRDLNAECQ